MQKKKWETPAVRELGTAPPPGCEASPADSNDGVGRRIVTEVKDALWELAGPASILLAVVFCAIIGHVAILAFDKLTGMGH